MKWAIRCLLLMSLAPGLAWAQVNRPPPVSIGALCYWYDGTHFQICSTSQPLPVTGTFSGTITTGGTASSTPPTYSAGANPLSLNLFGGLRDQISLGGVDISAGQQTSANSIPVVLPSDQTVPVATTPGTRTIVTLDVKTVTTGGTAVTALTAGHKTAGGWIQNPNVATVNLCINEISTAVGSTSSGDTTCIQPGVTYYLAASAGAVSVISSDSSHPFSGYGFQ